MDMGEKKRPGRFTVQFNLGDPQQARTAEILEQQGRQKARFISTAVLHYIYYTEIPEIAAPAAPDAMEIERIVLEMLKKYIPDDTAAPKPPPPPEKWVASPSPMPEQETGGDENLRSLLGDSGFAAIANTLASFRQK